MHVQEGRKNEHKKKLVKWIFTLKIVMKNTQAEWEKAKTHTNVYEKIVQIPHFL